MKLISLVPPLISGDALLLCFCGCLTYFSNFSPRKDQDSGHLDGREAMNELMPWNGLMHWNEPAVRDGRSLFSGAGKEMKA